MDQLRGGVPADKQPAVTVELKDDAVVYRRPSPTSQHRVFRDGSPYPAEWDKLDGSAKRLLIAKHRAAASGK
jgi:hypothetical protein